MKKFIAQVCRFRVPSGGRWCAVLFGCFGIVFIGFFIVESRLDVRVEEYFRPVRYPWFEQSTSALRKVYEATAAQLDDGDPVDRLELPRRSRSEQIVSRWRTKPKKNTWPNALLAWGLSSSLKGQPDVRHAATLSEFLDSVVDSSGRFRERPTLVEHVMIGVVLLEQAKQPGGARYRSAAKELLEIVLAELPRTATGTLAYNPSFRDHALVDTLGMVCPFLAEAGKVFDRPEATALAVHCLQEFLDKAVDRRTGLPWHAYRLSDGEPYGLLGWTRGVGWLFVGLAGTLEHLSPSEPGYEALRQAFSRLVERITPLQAKSGLWPWALSQGGSADSSGSAMIAWSILRGLRDGHLDDPRFERVAMAATAGVLAVTDQQGRVHQALGECQAVGHYPRQFDRFPWGQGPACALFALSAQVAPQ